MTKQIETWRATVARYDPIRRMTQELTADEGTHAAATGEGRHEL